MDKVTKYLMKMKKRYIWQRKKALDKIEKTFKEKDNIPENFIYLDPKKYNEKIFDIIVDKKVDLERIKVCKENGYNLDYYNDYIIFTIYGLPLTKEEFNLLWQVV